jgi:hypothetical protein
MKIAGIAFILLALVIGIVPQFTDCQSQGRAIELANGKTVAMKCHWTATAEIATAGPLLVMGLLFLRNQRRESVRNLAVLGAVTGAFTFLLPTYLIGVCMNNDMLCNMIMKPLLILSGILVITVSVIAFVLAGRQPTGPASSTGLPA